MVVKPTHLEFFAALVQLRYRSICLYLNHFGTAGSYENMPSRNL